MGETADGAETSLGPGLPLFPRGREWMEELDGLDWRDGVAFVVWGVRLGLRVTDPALLPDLLGPLPPAWRPSSTRRVQWLYSLVSRPSAGAAGDSIHHLYSGAGLLTRGSDRARIRSVFGTDVQLSLAVRSPWRTFVHAGAVGWKGQAIVLPGAGGTGKTTLTRALVRKGASLFSDEFAVLDRNGRVHPYPLPLRVKTGGGGEGEGGVSRQIPVEELGGAPAPGPLPVALVASTPYHPGGPGRLQRLSPGRGALEIMAHAVQARIRPRRVMETAGRTAEGATVLKGQRGEADEAAAMLLERLEGLGGLEEGGA